MPERKSQIDMSKIQLRPHNNPTAKTCLGRVKWFGDQKTGKQYGVITTADGKDVFFNKGNITESDYSPAESDYVILTITPSRMQSDSSDASDVRLLSSCADAKELFERLWLCHEPWRLSAVRGKPGECLRGLAHGTLDETFLLSLLPVILQGLVDTTGSVSQETLSAGYDSLFALSNRGVARQVIHQALKMKHPDALFAGWKAEVVDYSTDMVEVACRWWDRLSTNEQTRLLTEATPEGWDDFVKTFCRLEETLALHRILAVFTHAKTQREDQLQILSEIVATHGKPLLRLEIWIHGFGHCPSLEMVKSVVPRAGLSTQRSLLRRLFFEIEQVHMQWPISEICSFGWTDISTSVTCDCLRLLASGQQVTDQQIYETIVRTVMASDQNLGLEDLFDVCAGRAYCKQNADETTSVTIERAEPICRVIYRKGIKGNVKGPPIYCEGRPFEKNGESVLHTEYKKPFWRCRNLTCFEPSVSNSIRTNWNDYTLMDFALIAGVFIDMDKYQALLGALNRVNEVLEHMRCRKCNSILHPANSEGGQSNYAFYRVTHFQCKRADCDEKEIVYITHCLNYRCQKVIDSRDSAQCRVAEQGQSEIGWYVCRYCYCCCTTERIERRINLAKSRGQEYKGHTVGHADQGQICCPDCGNLLAEEALGDRKSVTWLETHKNDKTFVVEHGLREKEGTSWYLVRETIYKEPARLNKWLEHLIQCGFSVPDSGMKKSIYLIGTPVLRMKCTREGCGHELVVKEILKEKDYSRMTALRQHTLIAKAFPAPKVKNKEKAV